MNEFSPEFRAEFEQWRIARPAWKALLKAIRAGGDGTELASAAGASPAELREMVMVRTNARWREAEAAKYSAAKKRLAALDADVEKLRAAAEAATADEHGQALAELQQAVDTRARFMVNEYVGPEQSARYVAVARDMGVL
jgi:hypothetical protein